MREITKYVAEDGREFDTKERCLEYEQDVSRKKEVLNAMKVLKDFCFSHASCCDCPLHVYGDPSECSLFIDDCVPADWTEDFYLNPHEI